LATAILKDKETISEKIRAKMSFFKNKQQTKAKEIMAELL
jgi:hypothetical protein